MSNELAKQAYDLAEKEVREKQVQEVKKIVLKTLEKLEDLKKQEKDTSEKIKILKLDLEDLKEGKLDRISERQEKDEKAKETSVVIIIKEKEVIREVSPWYWPYQIIWPQPVYYPNRNIGQVTWCENSTIDNAPSFTTYTSINCSVAKDAAVGCYETLNGVVNFR